jgi:hypothetical protein
MDMNGSESPLKPTLAVIEGGSELREALNELFQERRPPVFSSTRV